MRDRERSGSGRRTSCRQRRAPRRLRTRHLVSPCCGAHVLPRARARRITKRTSLSDGQIPSAPVSQPVSSTANQARRNGVWTSYVPATDARRRRIFSGRAPCPLRSLTEWVGDPPGTPEKPLTLSDGELVLRHAEGLQPCTENIILKTRQKKWKPNINGRNSIYRLWGRISDALHGQ